MDFLTSAIGGGFGGGEISGARGEAFGSRVDVGVGGLTINKNQDVALLVLAVAVGGALVWLLKK